MEQRTAVLRVHDSGAGRRAIVIAPDPPNTIEHYAEVISLLEPSYRVLCFDLPGFGFSYPRRGFRFTVEHVSGVVSELLDRARVRRATLAMSCMGAFVSLDLAARRPDLVDRLVLSQVASADQMRQWVARISLRGTLTTPLLGQLLNHAVRRRMARGWYGVSVPARQDRAMYVEPAVQALRLGANFCLASAFQAFLREPVTYPKVGQDAILLWGVDDPTHRRTDPASALEHVPGATVVSCGECGHFPHLKDPTVLPRWVEA
jgi:pimeloyl-ACP methyl ester carboxylesterase